MIHKVKQVQAQRRLIRLNGQGPAAKVAAQRWTRRQMLAKGVYEGPLRLLSLIVAIGVPLACYSAVTSGATGWWPLIIAAATPLAILLLAWLRFRLASRREVKRRHPLSPEPPGA